MSEHEDSAPEFGAIGASEVRGVKLGKFCECGCGERVYPRPPKTRWKRGHNPRKRTDPLSFYSKNKNGCWIWNGPISVKRNGGYGTCMVNRKTRFAHTVVYEKLIGPIPPGLELDHLCRTRSCVNPKHLEPVSHAENCRRGKVAKLSLSDAETIRKIYRLRSHDRNLSVLAKMYNVKLGTIHAVIAGKTWK